MIRTLPLALALALGACATPPAADAPDPLELRTYTLPDGLADRVVGTLNRVFEQGREVQDVARATHGPSGTVVVVGPRTVLAGVDQLVEDLADLPAEVPRNLQLEYWLVRGIPGATSIPQELSAVGPVLEGIAQIDGAQTFELVAARRVTSLDGRHAEVSDSVVRKLSQVASIEPGGAVIADVTVEVAGRGGTVSTRLVMTPGNTMVLARAGDPDDDASGSLYVLVRPTIP